MKTVGFEPHFSRVTDRFLSIDIFRESFFLKAEKNPFSFSAKNFSLG
jgi:hypothetical protein